MRATSLSVVLVAVILSAGASLAQSSDESDPFAEPDELFENASDPFASYEEGAQEAENVTLVEPNPVADEDEDDDGDQGPPPADPGDEEERSTPGTGLLATLAGLCLALLVRPRR